MTKPSSWDVYLVTDREFSRGRSTREIVAAAIRGGVSVVQLREKNLDTRRFYEEGLAIRDLLGESGVPLIINDRIDLALALDADGVHLGQNDMPIAIARRILGPDRIIGLSVEAPAHVSDEAVSNSNYLAISPVFHTDTKTDVGAAWGLEGIRQVREMTRLPLIAIGSIKQANAKEVVMAGADCAAVITAITAADSPEEATMRLVEEVRAGKSQRAARPRKYGA